MRGNHGSKNWKKYINYKEFYRPNGKSGQVFEAIPKAADNLKAWKIVEIPGPAKVLVISDVHIPFHDEAALRAALKYGATRSPDLIILNGDIGDHFALSTFVKDPRLRDFPAEIRATKEFLKLVRNGFKKARIIYKLGNHEERFEVYMRVRAPELIGLDEFNLGEVLGLNNFGIELVGNKCPIKCGPLHILHGHEYRFAIQNPVSPARGLFLRGIGVIAMCGHFHQTSQHSGRSLSQHIGSTWSVGCLCNLHPEYMPLNNWNHGFAFEEVDKDGAFQVDNLRIVDGKVYR